MSLINTEKANNKYFKPSINENHSKVFKWLIDSGYTVRYISMMLDIDITMVNRKFKQPHNFTMHQFVVMCKMLEGKRTAAQILLHLAFVPSDESKDELKDIYSSVALPPAEGVQVYRSDYEPKKVKTKDK